MYRGRGRGRGGNYNRFAKEEKFEVFPEINELPVVSSEQAERFSTLVAWSDSLNKFWISSPYYLEHPKDPKNDEKSLRKPPLSDYMKMTSDHVPGELVGKNVRPSKKTRWDLQMDLKRLDFFEKLDKKTQDEDKKEDEEEDEDLENVEDDEDDSGDDYLQDGGFDDDEDDFNMNDDHDGDEGCY